MSFEKDLAETEKRRGEQCKGMPPSCSRDVSCMFQGVGQLNRCEKLKGDVSCVSPSCSVEQMKNGAGICSVEHVQSKIAPSCSGNVSYAVPEAVPQLFHSCSGSCSGALP